MRASAVTPPRTTLRRAAGRRRQNDVRVDRNLSRSFRRYAQKRSAHPSSRPTRGSLAGLSIGERDAPPEARAGGLPACQPRLQSPGGLRSAALTHPAAPRAEARRACISANGMRPLKPAQAGFLPASRDLWSAHVGLIAVLTKVEPIWTKLNTPGNDAPHAMTEIMVFE